MSPEGDAGLALPDPAAPPTPPEYKSRERDEDRHPDEQPRQREVPELTPVAGLVLSGQALCLCPSPGLSQPALRDPNPGPQRPDWARLGDKAARV